MDKIKKQGWMIYFFDQEELLNVSGIYSSEETARGILREKPYKSLDDLHIQIKYKIMKVDIFDDSFTPMKV